MVRVVVVHGRAPRGVPEQLKAPAGSVEAGEAGDRGRGLRAGQPGGMQRAGGVDRVVHAGNGQAHLLLTPAEA